MCFNRVAGIRGIAGTNHALHIDPSNRVDRPLRCACVWNRLHKCPGRPCQGHTGTQLPAEFGPCVLVAWAWRPDSLAISKTVQV